MYSALVSSRALYKHKVKILKFFVHKHLSPQNLANFKTAIRLKNQPKINDLRWEPYIEASLNDLMFIYNETAKNVAPTALYDVPILSHWATSKHRSPYRLLMNCKRPTWVYHTKNTIKKLLDLFL